MTSVTQRGVALLMAGRGRIAAVAVLLLFVLVQASVGDAVFSGPRLALFDLYERLVPRARKSAPVVIVAVDEASLAAYGQWPWPRQRVAELIERILAGHPAALGVDIIWPEFDASSPARWAAQQHGLTPALHRALLDLPDHDAELAAALAKGPVTIGIAGQRDDRPDHPGPLAPARLLGGMPSGLPVFRSTLRSLPILDQAAAGHGLLSIDLDADGMVRRVPTVSLLGGHIAPGFSIETLRLAARSPWLNIRLDGAHMRGIELGPLSIPTQADGRIWVDFTATDARRFVSAGDVLAARLPADAFDQRLVLIGVTGLGLIDHFNTPLGVMPGVEVHAQVMENVFDGRYATRPDWASSAEEAITLGLGLVMIVGLPLLRLRWQALAAAGLLVAPCAIGLAGWAYERWLIDAVTPVIADAAVFVALLAGSLAEADRQRRLLRSALEKEKLAAATMEGELAAAFRIQMGILPKAQDLLPDPRFNLEAEIVPAKHVGGDLFDFFKIDDDHLFIAIGDVSGKGVPASLFMAVGKALCKSCALRDEFDIGEIILRANAEISRDNTEMLFITMFAGILDLRTGRLSFCNAGHDPPFLAIPGQPPRQMTSIGGPPLCVMDDFPYRSEEYQLAPGEILCLVTDGVTEAMNPAGDLMGHERVEAAFVAQPSDGDARSLAHLLRQAVATFVDGAPPSDDLTLLAVQWTGGAAAAPSGL